MPTGQAEDALQNPRPLDAVGHEHRFGPLERIGTDVLELLQQVRNVSVSKTSKGQVLRVSPSP